MRGCTSGLAGGCSNPKLAGLGERGTETWVLGERLIDTPWGFDCRDEGSAETAGVEDGSETRTHSTPVSAAGTARRRYALGPFPVWAPSCAKRGIDLFGVFRRLCLWIVLSPTFVPGRPANDRPLSPEGMEIIYRRTPALVGYALWGGP